MKEDLLQFIWQYGLFEKKFLKIDQEPVQILKPGTPNFNSGPDFLNALIKIGSTIWAGNVEIHIDAKDWFVHKHHLNKQYSNVILHVVLNNDLKPEQAKQINIPLLELKNAINPDLSDKYQSLMNSKTWIPCQDNIPEINDFSKSMFLSRLCVERFEQRTDDILKLLSQNNMDWMESFYQYMGRAFGFNTNSEAFLTLTRHTPFQLLKKHANDLFSVEALLFGQSGLLQKKYFEDDYPNKLLLEYKYLKKKYHLTGISSNIWFHSRMRPANFPEIRIAQFASLIVSNALNFSRILETDSVKDYFSFFKAETSSYWNNHYSFDQFSLQNRKKKLGKQSVAGIIINVILPFVFAYGHYHKKNQLKEKAIDMLENMPAEKNSILSNWQNLGFPNEHAAHSQALLYLKKSMCNKKSCLNCHIGHNILR